MDIKYKLYPYPVLASFNDYYVDSKFETDAIITEEGFDIVIPVKSTLENDTLRDLIAHGKACFLYHVECPKSGFRQIYETDKYDYVIRINEEKLNGVVSFCSFIIAKEDIKGYCNEKFNPEYEFTEPINIVKNSIIAVGSGISQRIDKKLTNLLNSSSPFAINVNPDESVFHMVVEYEANQKIRILLPKAAKPDYDALHINPQLKNILNSMIVVPALAYVLNAISKDPEQAEYAFNGRLWYESIKASLQKNFNKDIKNLADEDTYELAQRLLRSPVTDAMKDLSNIRQSDDEEEE